MSITDHAERGWRHFEPKAGTPNRGAAPLPVRGDPTYMRGDNTLYGKMTALREDRAAPDRIQKGT